MAARDGQAAQRIISDFPHSDPDVLMHKEGWNEDKLTLTLLHHES